MAAIFSIIVCRPARFIDSWVPAISQAGFNAVALPLIQSIPIYFELPQHFDGLIFTSAQAVIFFHHHLLSRKAPEHLRNMPVRCVGIGTLQEALKIFPSATHPDNVKNGKELFSYIAKNEPGTRWLWPNSRLSEIQNLPAEIHPVAVYDTHAVIYTEAELRVLIPDSPRIVFITSPSIAAAWSDLPSHIKSGTFVISIGNVTTAALQSRQITPVAEAKMPALSAMLDEAVAFAANFPKYQDDCK